jgi:hypothetical protein
MVGLAEAALGEGSGIKLHKLSVKELKTVSEQSPAVGDLTNSAPFPAVWYEPR